MDFITVYPVLEPKPSARRILRAVATIFLICGCLASGIVNLCAGGEPWILYVVGGAVVFWTVFLYHPIVEQSLLKKVTACILSACGYLILIDLLSAGEHWSKLVVPIVLFSLLIFFILVFFIRFKRQKSNVFPLSWVFLISLAVIISAAFGFKLSFTWPVIVLASLDGVILILGLVLYLKPIAREFHKKFHFN